MVFVPNAPLSPAALGWGDGFPRAVPSDAVAALLGMVLPGDVVQTLLLLTVFVLGAAGAARLVPGPGLAARSAAALAYVWNPFLAERLLNVWVDAQQLRVKRYPVYMPEESAWKANLKARTKSLMYLHSL